MSDEQHNTVTEIASLWRMSTSMVRELFRDEPGVIKIERRETRSKRGYTTLYVPKSIAKRVHDRISH